MRGRVLTVVAALVALLVLMPLVWMVAVIFMAPGEAAQFPPPLVSGQTDAGATTATLFENDGVGTISRQTACWYRASRQSLCAAFRRAGRVCVCKAPLQRSRRVFQPLVARW